MRSHLMTKPIVTWKVLIGFFIISTILFLIITHRNGIIITYRNNNSTTQATESHKFQHSNESTDTDQIIETDEFKSTTDSTGEKTVSDEFRFKLLNYTKKQIENIEQAKRCYQMNDSVKNVQFLDDLEKSPPKPDKAIFFTPTSCINDGQITLNAREACAVESAATQNPNRDIFVLFIPPVGFVSNKPVSPLIAALQTLQNVHFRNVNIYELSKGTPAEEWVKQDKIFLSPYFKTHISDYLRIVALYKYGGIYFDTDFIVIKSVDGMAPNFVAVEDPEYINNSVFRFSSNGTGHRMADMILRECIEKYNEGFWDHNGPFAVRRAMLKVCNIDVDNKDAVHKMQPEFCEGIKAYPNIVFYPIGHGEAIQTNPEVIKNLLKKITNESVAIHLWSSIIRDNDILKSGPKMVYTIMAEKFCKKSYGASGLHFNKK